MLVSQRVQAAFSDPHHRLRSRSKIASGMLCIRVLPEVITICPNWRHREKAEFLQINIRGKQGKGRRVSKNAKILQISYVEAPIGLSSRRGVRGLDREGELQAGAKTLCIRVLPEVIPICPNWRHREKAEIRKFCGCHM